MGINFHSATNGTSYTTRNADQNWKEVISKLVPLDTISNALDIGCGGGIYCKALVDLGIERVTAMDFSEAMLEGAKENCKGYKNISFRLGTASHTCLKSNSYNLLLERALIHHLHEVQTCFQEAYRLLSEQGTYIVQDRTPDDCFLPGDPSHIRGYVFELFPRLIEKETTRRYSSQVVTESLKKEGFKEIEEIKLWETRKVYEDKQALEQDLRNRTGRSILHELTDDELDTLVNYIVDSLPDNDKIIEKDRWTIWKAVK